MLKIRLARFGKKKRPTYRLIVSEASRDTFGTYLENLGHYNPMSKVCDVKKDRILYWISKGAQLSPTAHNLLINQNVIEGKKVRAYIPKKKQGEEKPAAKPAAAEKPKEAAPAGQPAAEKTEEKAPAEPTVEKTEEKTPSSNN